MLKNVVANWSNVIVSMLAVFILYPFFLKTLGEEQYGVWLLISSATGFFSLLQMGVPMANVRFISKYYAKKEYDLLNEVVCTNLFFFTVGALLIFLSGFGLAFLLDFFFDIPSEFIRLAKIATVVVCLEISIRFVFEVFEGFFHAKQQFVIFNIIKNIMIFARIGVTFALVRYDNGLLWVAIVLLIITIIQSLIFFFYVFLRNPFLKIRLKNIKYEAFKEIFGYSIFVLLLQLGAKINFKADALVLGSVVSVSSVVWFNIGNNLLVYFMKFMSGISRTLMPRISDMDARGKSEGVGAIYCDYSRIVMFLVLPACLCFWCYGGDFIALWMGEQFRYVSGDVLSILTIGYLLYMVQAGVALPILMGTSNVKFPTILILSASLLNLSLSILLGTKYGILGVAWGTTIPLVFLTLIIVVYMCRCFNIKLSYYLKHAVCVPFLSSIPFFIVFWFVKQKIVINTYFFLVISSALCLLSYFVVVFFIFMTKIEKKWLAGKVLKR